jgi:hypothetical protein
LEAFVDLLQRRAWRDKPARKPQAGHS